MQMKIHNPNELKVIDYRTAKPLQENLKDLHTAQHDQLLAVLTNRGFKQPLNLWHKGDDFFLMDGHQRQRVMTKNDMNDNGSYEVPYFVTEAATKKEAVEQLLEITSQYGKTTPDGLDELASMYELELGDLDIHFDAIDMDKFLDDHLDADEADDEAPEVDEVNPPVSVLGEVYQLGAHRLMCGDSTSLEAVERLMDGAKADMVHTDPPYGVAYKGNSNPNTQNSTNSGKAMEIKGDKLSGDELENLFGDSMANAVAVTIDKAAFYIWYATSKTVETLQGVSKAGLDVRAYIFWYKVNSPMSAFMSQYIPNYEPLLYCLKQGGSLNWYGDSNEKCIWEHQVKLGDRVHPTEKPIGLPTIAIKNSSKRGGLVLDLFLGSGSTLIAADKLNRICYGMELDERYCDVIRKRYAKHIGAEDWQAATPAEVLSGTR